MAPALGTTVAGGPRPAGRERPTGLRSVLPALLPALVLAGLGGRLVAQRRSLWYDELYTAEVGTAGLDALARSVLEGVGTAPYLADVPPSYNAPFYVAVHAWLAVTRLPADEVGLRLLPLVASVAAVAVLARAVQRLAGPAAGLGAGLLAATSPLVVEYSAEARMYGLALLATATAALGLARWLDGARRGLLLYVVGAALGGLAHWFVLPAVAGLAVAALVLRRAAAVPVLAATVAAALPAAALVALVVVNGTGTAALGRIEPLAEPLPVAALRAWTGGDRLLAATWLVALALAAGRAWRSPALRPAAAVGAAWLLVPLAVLQVAELLRPVFVGRYLLPALLGAAALAAVGASAGRLRVPLTGVLVGLSVVAALPLYDRGPRDDARGAVAALAALHRPGEPVVAVDTRAALALDHYAPDDVRRDLRLPPQDPPAGAGTVWLLRQTTGSGGLAPSDDDAALLDEGLQVQASWRFDGWGAGLVLQRWAR